MKAVSFETDEGAVEVEPGVPTEMTVNGDLYVTTVLRAWVSEVA